MRQLAWLHAPIERRDAQGRTLREASRIEAGQRDGLTFPLPPAAADFMADWLFEAGPVRRIGEADVPLDWVDLSAWADMNGIELAPWQASLLRRLSSAYLGAWHAGKDPDCPPPWLTEDAIAANREAVMRKLDRAFDQFEA